MNKAEIKEFAKGVGGVVALSHALGLSRGAVSQWGKVPAERVVEVERITGIPRSRLRPDLFDEAGPAASEPVVTKAA